MFICDKIIESIQFIDNGHLNETKDEKTVKYNTQQKC